MALSTPPARKIHLYHCDHRGLPLALVSTEGATEWCAEYDEWGNLLNEENPHQLQQLIRLPGQQYDEESGLYYNRHRYYDPLQGRYITQDPIGLKGGWNFYQYPLNPASLIDIMQFSKLEGVVDLIYNPRRTVLLLQAEMMDIPHCDGLPFLVAQGVEAANHFQGESFGTKEIEQILRDMRREKENIILIGMPGVGKTTVGKAIGKEMGRTCMILRS